MKIALWLVRMELFSPFILIKKKILILWGREIQALKGHRGASLILQYT